MYNILSGHWRQTLAVATMAAGAMLLSTAASANVVTIPQSALVSSNQYYTDSIGGGIGTALVMTGGGNAANVGGTRNDDGFSGPIDLGFTLNFYGNDYTQFWANNNGNISFNNGIAAFTPDGPQGASQPIISPFFADVDTRGAGSGLMYLRNDIANEIIITWDGVGYFGNHDDKLNSFQLVLRGPDYAVPAGEGAIGFFYKDMQWETGDASSGTGGFGGLPAAVGFGQGSSSGDGNVLEGSTTSGISQVVGNHHIWFNQNLTPVPPSGAVPEPATWGMLIAGFLGIGLVARRREDEAKAAC